MKHWSRSSISIERLIQWALIDEKVQFGDAMAGLLDVTGGYPEDSIVRCERVDTMGGFITGTAPGARVVASHSADEAVEVADRISRLPSLQRELVIRHGRSGLRPDWRPYAFHCWRPVEVDHDGVAGVSERCDHRRVAGGHPLGYWWAGGRKGKRREYSYWVPVREVDTPAAIDTHRRHYRTWWDALFSLRMQLGHVVGRWEITAEMPKREPWA